MHILMPFVFLYVYIICWQAGWLFSLDTFIFWIVMLIRLIFITKLPFTVLSCLFLQTQFLRLYMKLKICVKISLLFSNFNLIQYIYTIYFLFSFDNKILYYTDVDMVRQNIPLLEKSANIFSNSILLLLLKYIPHLATTSEV